MQTPFSTTLLAFGALMLSFFCESPQAQSGAQATTASGSFGSISMPDSFVPHIQSIHVQSAGKAEIIGEAPAYVIQKKYGADKRLPLQTPQASGTTSPRTSASNQPLAAKTATQVKTVKPTPKPVAKPNPIKPEKMTLAFTAGQSVNTAQQNAMGSFARIIAKRPAQNRKHVFITSHVPSQALESAAKANAQPIIKALQAKKLLSGAQKMTVHELIFTQGNTAKGKLEVLVK